MRELSIVLAATEGAAYLRISAEAALAASADCGVTAELVIVVSDADRDAAEKELRGIEGIRLQSADTQSLAKLSNLGAAGALGTYALFLREGVLLHAEGLRAMLDTLCINERIGAVGPFSNRTTYSWQYLNVARMEADGAVPAQWVREHIIEPSESLVLENFALLLRRETFAQMGGFCEDFSLVGGEDIDLSFRLRTEGKLLLRAPVYVPHTGAETYNLYDMTRSAARAVLLERWGLDIGIPEKIWWEALEGIDWRQGLYLIAATCRSALLKTPLVSIMIPTYNRPAYFRETLESARAQTYPNIEIIVCDNSTDDRTEELMRTYRDDLRIRYVRNRAVQTKEENFMPFEHLAQGEFLQWCMDDDLLLPDKLTLMVDTFLQYPEATLATSARGGIDADGAFMGLRPNMPPLHGEYEVLDGTAVGHTLLTHCANFIGEPSAVLFRRKDLTHHYWRAEARGYVTISDCVMWLELLEHGHCVMFSHPLSLYRMHPAQEGQRPEILVRSRIEWRRLLEEYWKRRIFIMEEADYQGALTRLQEDVADTIEPLLEQVSPGLRREYETGIPPLSVIVVNRIEVCAAMRFDVPFHIMEARGEIILGGVRKGQPPMVWGDVLKKRDSILIIQRGRDGEISETAGLFKVLTSQGNLLLHEIDDFPDARELRPSHEESLPFSLGAVSAVQTSTTPLADFLREFNPYVLLFENQLPALPPQRMYHPKEQHLTIFFGALNRRTDWEPIMPAINDAIHTYGERLSFLVTADRAFYDALQTPQKEYIGSALIAPYELYTAALHASDIALLPLRDTAFNRAKSDLKFIESAGHGAVVLASPTVYERTVRDGETGMIYHDLREFSEKLSLLIERPELRMTIAQNAYRYVAEHRLIEHHIDAQIAAYRELFARREELERARRARMEKYFPHLIS